MELKKISLALLLGLTGPILLILSEFFPWFSEHTLFEIFLLTTDVPIENSFLFIFPLMSGIICLIANIIVLYDIEYRIKSVILSFVGLGFQLIFFIDHISQEIDFLSSADAGFYLGVFGFLLIIINVINVLSTVEN